MSTGGTTIAPGATLVYSAALATPLGAAQLWGTARGLLLIALPGESRGFAETWLRRKTGATSCIEDPAAFREASAQLTEYFAGTRTAFDLPIDWRGTAFQRAAWEAVMAVPYGETRTYGAIAAALGRPNAARAVGAANGANPLAPIVPCHRLVGGDGSLRGYGAGLATKRWLIALERGALRAPGASGAGEPLL
jgi:methylated-DNA-[protein]-cysteine S-methyltransferase